MRGHRSSLSEFESSKERMYVFLFWFRASALVGKVSFMFSGEEAGDRLICDVGDEIGLTTIDQRADCQKNEVTNFYFQHLIMKIGYVLTKKFESAFDMSKP